MNLETEQLIEGVRARARARSSHPSAAVRSDADRMMRLADAIETVDLNGQHYAHRIQVDLAVADQERGELAAAVERVREYADTLSTAAMGERFPAVQIGAEILDLLPGGSQSPHTGHHCDQSDHHCDSVSHSETAMTLAEGETQALMKMRKLGVDDAADRFGDAAILEAAGASHDLVQIAAKIAATVRIAGEDLLAMERHGIRVDVARPSKIEPVAWRDREGDAWVDADGGLRMVGDSTVESRRLVEATYGPLTPIHESEDTL
ncbi:hypothetical protein [Microbacterium sp. gxy059]|uniref:hypothetical protein n=1 Tax=Microbacterium sp. gxy059 TaxID=2957199 RepID=UPI003D95CBE0